jgi:hypothetical protein
MHGTTVKIVEQVVSTKCLYQLPVYTMSHNHRAGNLKNHVFIYVQLKNVKFDGTVFNL